MDKTTFKFFKDLANHNEREWFQENKPLYDQIVLKTQELISIWAHELEDLEPLLRDTDPKKSIFRIYRDVRFSKNKIPYKTHIGMAIGRSGKSDKWAGWYLHIEPNNKSFLAAGKWSPESNELKAIRQEIDYNLEDFYSIINDKNFVQTFESLDKGNTLKKAPKDYDADHKAIEFLKLKAFTVSKSYSDDEVLNDSFIKKIIQDSRTAFPFLQFINRSLEDLY
ncbi:MAG TPA: DUF2461 domain-containing protein [Chitinophagales bacterium]|nr:DUF2461 domain-containing protein [Chitinophagales bacterium]